MSSLWEVQPSPGSDHINITFLYSTHAYRHVELLLMAHKFPNVSFNDSVKIYSSTKIVKMSNIAIVRQAINI